MLLLLVWPKVITLIGITFDNIVQQKNIFQKKDLTFLLTEKGIGFNILCMKDLDWA